MGLFDRFWKKPADWRSRLAAAETIDGASRRRATSGSERGGTPSERIDGASRRRATSGSERGGTPSERIDGASRRRATSGSERGGTPSERIDGASRRRATSGSERGGTPSERIDLALVREVLIAALHEGLGHAATVIDERTLSLPLPDRSPITLYLDNLYARLQLVDAADRVTAVEQYVKSVADSVHREPGAARTRESIVPMVKDAIFVAEHEAAMGRHLAKRHLCADLWVLYAQDLPASVEYLGEDEVRELGVAGDELHALALENLQARLPSVQRHASNGAERLTCGGTFEASLLLFAELWESIAEEVSGELVACVPARDMTIFTGTAVPGGVERIRGIAERVLADGDRPLTGTLLRWTGDGWEPWQGT